MDTLSRLREYQLWAQGRVCVVHARWLSAMDVIGGRAMIERAWRAMVVYKLSGQLGRTFASLSSGLRSLPNGLFGHLSHAVPLPIIIGATVK